MSFEPDATWPESGVNPEDAVATRCGDCGISWLIHQSMCGFRVRCRCGGWVETPELPPARKLEDPAALPSSESSEFAVVKDEGDVSAPPAVLQPSAKHVPAEFRGVRAWDGKPLERDRDGSWTLRHASLEDRNRWTTRAVLELVFVMLAFLLPQVVIAFTTYGSEQAFWMPIASVCSSLLCLLVVRSEPGYVIEALRLPRVAYMLEAAVATAIAFGFAMAWQALLESAFRRMLDPESDPLMLLIKELGLGLSLFVISVCPGIFEEVAFRGLIQGRLTRILGVRSAIWVSGTAFALAHGVTLALPIHAALGFYLGSLRVRSGSLIPGIALHMAYNGALVVAVWLELQAS